MSCEGRVGVGTSASTGRLPGSSHVGPSRAVNLETSVVRSRRQGVSNDQLCRSPKEISRCRTICHPTSRAAKNDQRLTRLTSPSRRLSPHGRRSRNRRRSLTMSTAHRSRQIDGALKRRSRAVRGRPQNQAAAPPQERLRRLAATTARCRRASVAIAGMSNETGACFGERLGGTG
jgi:hypothetical protein